MVLLSQEMLPHPSITNWNAFIEHIQSGAQNVNGKVLFKGKANHKWDIFNHSVIPT